MFERDKCFIGREDIIAEIDRCLLLESHVAIAGVGGVGQGLPNLPSFRQKLIFLRLLGSPKSPSNTATDSKRRTLEAACFGSMPALWLGFMKLTKQSLRILAYLG